LKVLTAKYKVVETFDYSRHYIFSFKTKKMPSKMVVISKELPFFYT